MKITLESLQSVATPEVIAYFLIIAVIYKSITQLRSDLALFSREKKSLKKLEALTEQYSKAPLTKENKILIKEEINRLSQLVSYGFPISKADLEMKNRLASKVEWFTHRHFRKIRDFVVNNGASDPVIELKWHHVICDKFLIGSAFLLFIVGSLSLSFLLVESGNWQQDLQHLTQALMSFGLMAILLWLGNPYTIVKRLKNSLKKSKEEKASENIHSIKNQENEKVA